MRFNSEPVPQHTHATPCYLYVVSDRDQIERAVLDVLERFPGIELAILFGSQVSGHARPDSDLDLAVDAGHSLDASEKIALVSELASALGRPVDLVDLRTAGEPLLGEIVNGGRRLLGTDASFAALVSRHLVDAADFLPYVERMLAERRAAWLGK